MKDLNINLEETIIGKLQLFLIIHKSRIEVFRLAKKIEESEKRRSLHNLLAKLAKNKEIVENEEFLLCDRSNQNRPTFVFYENENTFSKKNQASFKKCGRELSAIGKNFIQFFKLQKLSQYKTLNLQTLVDFQNNTYLELHEIDNFPRGVFSKLNNKVREEFNALLEQVTEVQPIFYPEVERTKFTLNEYWGLVDEDAEGEFVGLDISTNIFDPVEFSTFYQNLEVSWIKLTMILVYLFGFTTEELTVLTYDKIKNFVLENEKNLTETELLRAKLGNAFQNKNLNYKQELLEEGFAHFVLARNERLFSRNGKLMNLKVVQRKLKDALEKETKLLVLRYHAPVHYLYYSNNKKLVSNMYSISTGSIYNLCHQIYFSLEQLQFSNT